ncbi:MAG: ABC transporter substrate-binding protein [Chloroflexota bacterium]|nr:ABC transporter substrate-binding protein [Chloroflexota bacterium]
MQESALGEQQLSRRTLLAMAGTIVGGATFISCGGSQAPPSNAPLGGPKRPVIALIVGSKSDPFYTTMARGAQSRASQLGVDLVVDGPATFSATLQTPIVDAMIAKRVNVIIIAACDKQVMIAPLKRAYDAHINVISVDTFIGDGNYVNGPITFPLSYIGSDNIEGGRLAGNALIKSIGGKGKVYIQETSPGSSSVDQRVQGFKNALQAANGLVTLAGVDYNYHSLATARQETVAMLQRISDIKGIFGTNVGSGEGAAQGVKLAQQQGRIKIANFDAPEQTVADIKNGLIDIAIAQKPAQMGDLAVGYAFKVLTGGVNEIKKRVTTGFVVITKNTIDTPEAQAAIYRNT